MFKPAFRAARETDVDAIVDLVDSAYRGERSRAGWTSEADLVDGRRTDAAMVRGILAWSASGILLVTDAHDVILGCCQLAKAHGGAYFGMFAVQPTRQAGGLGKALLAEAESRARSTWGAATLTLTVLAPRTDIIEWYERRGYVRTGHRKPFPYGDSRFGRPRGPGLELVEFAKVLAQGP